MTRTPGAQPLALTMGDPAGIGPDITLMAWRQRNERGLPPFVLFGDIDVLTARAKGLGLDMTVAAVPSPTAACAVFATALPVISNACAAPVIPGRPDGRNAPATIACIQIAVAACETAEVRAVVTNPIAKSVLYGAGFSYSGHTEFLAHLAEAARPGSRVWPVMMLVAGDLLRVVPATIHIPLAHVSNRLSRELLLDVIRATNGALIRDFGIPRPRIAVAGLNPHAGESGTIGTEDRDLIAPVIAELVADDLDVTGPHPADTLFHAAARTRYDAAVCMYHDQALIPIKTLAFESGVNTTLGLPFVRTSPDHGTAFDIAGTGKASPESLIQAVLLAHRMATARDRATR